jgi:NADPH:quinone reductase-like Zn-dependent oxidoreductase
VAISQQGSAMKAITRDRYGSSDVLTVSEVDKPTIGDDEVLIRVRAAGIGPDVWHVMTGLPYFVRAMGFGLRRPKSPLLGLDVAGTVDGVGGDVTQFQVGDDVFGTADGALAEYASTEPDKIAPKPGNLTFEQAATVPVSGCTAVQGLRDAARLQAGQTVLIIGASGGVGTFAVQLAKAFGATVVGVCSTPKAELVRSLGADRVIDYTCADFADGADLYHVILDTAGRRPLSRLRRALAPRGTLVLVGGEGGGRLSGGFERQLAAAALSPFIRQRLRPLMSDVRQVDLTFLKHLIEAGDVTPVVGRTFPLAEAADALRDADEGHGHGKTVVAV